jgi:SET domain-containing protein
MAILFKLKYINTGGKNLSNKPMNLDSFKMTEDDLDKSRLDTIVTHVPMTLDNVELRPSRIHGRGVFAKRNIRENEIITFYPADILVYNPESLTADPKKLVIKADFFGADITESAKANFQNDNNYYKDYRCTMIPYYDVIGTPEHDSDPTYMGHFVNDSVRYLKGQETACQYMAKTVTGANCAFMRILDLHIAVVAIRNINAGEELCAPYGSGYWEAKTD